MAISIKNSVLILEPKSEWAQESSEGLKITIYSDELRNVALMGNGDLRCEQEFPIHNFKLILMEQGSVYGKFSGESLDFTLLGLGNIFNEGTVHQLLLSILCNGNIETKFTEAKITTALILGNGQINLHSTSHLEVNIPGNGQVQFRGNPQLKISIAGNGLVMNIE